MNKKEAKKCIVEMFETICPRLDHYYVPYGKEIDISNILDIYLDSDPKHAETAMENIKKLKESSSLFDKENDKDKVETKKDVPKIKVLDDTFSSLNW